ncbi:MAG: energy transducer TonB [Burkholderiales bacterium]
MLRNGISAAALLVMAALAASGSAQSRNAAGSTQSMRVAQAAPGNAAETRPARRQEVRVQVLLLSEKLKDNPQEYIEVGGARYIHFKSPRLKSPARPLGDPKLRYPTGRLEQRSGAVMLQLLINEFGWLVQADVVCAAPPFEKAALESVQGLKFQPAVAREGPVKSYMLVEFSYGKGYPCGRVPD